MDDIYIPADMPYKKQIEHVVNNKLAAVTGYLGLASDAVDNDQSILCKKYLKKAIDISLGLSKQIGAINAEQN